MFTQDGSAWLLGSTVAYRYAGEEWEAFTLPSGNRVTDLYDVAVEADGAVWLGTGHGALRYDGLKR